MPSTKKFSQLRDDARRDPVRGFTRRVLRDLGPTLGRPLVDTIKGSRHSNMKELRPGSTGRTEIRVLFGLIGGLPPLDGVTS